MTPSRTPAADFQLFSVPAFPTGRPESIKGEAIGSSKQSVEINDVLLCKINPRINRVWRVTDLGIGTPIASTEWIRFASHSDVEPDFLRLFLMRDEVREYLAANASGVGGSLMRVRPSTVSPIAFPLPNLEVQRGIVARIDELFTDLDDGEAALARARADLGTWRKALLKAAVTGELTADWRAANPPTETGADLLARILSERRARWHAQPRNEGKRYVEPEEPSTGEFPALPIGWVWTTVGALLQDGIQNGLYLPQSAYGGTIPIMRIDDFQAASAQPSSMLRRVVANEEIQLLYSLRVGDYILNRVNSLSHLGKSFLVREQHVPALFESNMMRMRPSDLIEKAFLELYLSCEIGRGRICRNAKAAVNQASINQTDVSQTPVPLPPKQEQIAIVISVNDASKTDLVH